MKFYITPESKSSFEKKFATMVKTFDHKPSVTYSNVQKVQQETNFVYDRENYETQYKIIEVIEVEIEDVAVGEWQLVASVLFDQDIVALVNGKYFKDMPKQYGLNYEDCDICHTRKDRKEAHILYNTKTKEWKQVGSTCMHKLTAHGKYLNNFMVKLYKTIDMLGGCSEEEWLGDGFKFSPQLWREAIPIEKAVECVVDYRANVSKNYYKAEYSGGKRVTDSTNDDLQAYYNSNRKKWLGKETKLFKAVAKLVSKMGDTEVQQKMKSAFADKFLKLTDIWVVFFAVKNYEDAQERAGFETTINKRAIAIDNPITIHARLENKQVIEGFYGKSMLYTFVDDELTFQKEMSLTADIEKFKKDGLYHFQAKVKYINHKKAIVVLGGRLSTIKK